MARGMLPYRSARGRGFTLLEMMIVLVVIAILTAITVPRLFRSESRQFKVTVEQVADLLTMFAQRESLGQKPVGIWYDQDRHWLVLMVMDVDPARPQEPADWYPDLSVRPVKLPEWVHEPLVSEDGVPVDIRRWPLSTRPGEARPMVGLTLMTDERSASLELSPYAIAPYQSDEEAALLAARTPVDLDAAGRSREDW